MAACPPKPFDDSAVSRQLHALREQISMRAPPIIAYNSL